MGCGCKKGRAQTVREQQAADRAARLEAARAAQAEKRTPPKP